jgi:hypothetical protein
MRRSHPRAAAARTQERCRHAALSAELKRKRKVSAISAVADIVPDYQFTAIIVDEAWAQANRAVRPIQQRTAIGFAQFTRSYSLTTALAPFTPRVWLTISLCAALPM